MSREIGGRADKDGNEFERLWVIDQALRLLQGIVISLQWEPPGKAGFGMELEVVLPDSRREIHQCKIERTRMIESSNEKAAERGAFWVKVGQVAESLYGELAARCYEGSEVLRKGAVEAMGKLLQWPEVKDGALSGFYASSMALARQWEMR